MFLYFNVDERDSIISSDYLPHRLARNSDALRSPRVFVRPAFRLSTAIDFYRVSVEKRHRGRIVWKSSKGAVKIYGDQFFRNLTPPLLLILYAYFLSASSSSSSSLFFIDSSAETGKRNIFHAIEKVRGTIDLYVLCGNISIASSRAQWYILRFTNASSRSQCCCAGRLAGWLQTMHMNGFSSFIICFCILTSVA